MGKEIIPWDGYCYVHERIGQGGGLLAKRRILDASLFVHPECCPSVVDVADEVLSTTGMVNFAKESDEKRFLIGTESGLIYRLKRENPGKEFYTAGAAKICATMKLTTLDDVYLALKEERYPIELTQEIIEPAREAMLKYV